MSQCINNWVNSPTCNQQYDCEHQVEQQSKKMHIKLRTNIIWTVQKLGIDVFLEFQTIPLLSMKKHQWSLLLRKNQYTSMF